MTRFFLSIFPPLFRLGNSSKASLPATLMPDGSRDRSLGKSERPGPEAQRRRIAIDDLLSLLNSPRWSTLTVDEQRRLNDNLQALLAEDQRVINDKSYSKKSL